jgi:diguanylate cyclase (GGDEF)-like protein
MKVQPYRVIYSLRSCLFAVFGFLFVLPLLGVGFGALALRYVTDDISALDRAARGTIHLHEINGFVYAVVMESRGIYMSANWTDAAPFAGRLNELLGELKAVAKTWKTEAIASQQSNVDELARRIDQFVEFRTELVRLAREDSTAAARVFGDNEANRSVRTALNESLSVVAHAYEEEIGRARDNVNRDERDFMIALAILSVVAFITLCGGVMLVNRKLLIPLLRVKNAMLRLSHGQFDVDSALLQQAVEIDEMVQAISVFHGTMVDRQKLNHEVRLLSELNEWLQSCNSLGELYDMVARFLARLIPGCAGNLYIYSNSRDVLETAKVWNGAKVTAAGMDADDCWALRRGRTYTFGDAEIDFPCAHVSEEHPGPYCCIPILAHGETIGLLHLEFRDDASGEDKPSAAPAVAEQRRLGLVCAEQISLAIANVKLRDQLRDQSIRDPLTNLFNRRYMLETSRREFSRAARTHQPVSMLSIDVDHFKKYNDNHGHDAGDMVLRAVGECMSSVFREEDVPCRFGGEEFVVILPGASLEDSMRRAEQLRGRVESLVVRYLDENLPRITISVGVAAFPGAGDTPDMVLKAADKALYRAKDNGRNRVESATAEPIVIAPPKLPLPRLKKVSPTGTEALAEAVED